jgi:hypothetical protein
MDPQEKDLDSNYGIEKAVGKARKPQANSIGNKYKFAQQKKKLTGNRLLHSRRKISR